MQNRDAVVHQVVGLIGGRWTLAVLSELQDEGRRYQELDEALDGVSHKVLTETLRRLERDGLVVRHIDPSRVDTATLYELTVLGRLLEEPLIVLGRWGQTNWSHVEAARRGWDRRRNV